MITSNLMLTLATVVLVHLASFQEEPRVVRIALEKVLSERTIDLSERATLVVDTMLYCGAKPCESAMPDGMRTFLRDTARVQLGAAASVVRCDLSTFPRKCTLHGGTAALKLHYPRIKGDTAWIGHTWTELLRGNLWSYGAEWRFVQRQGAWRFCVQCTLSQSM